MSISDATETNILKLIFNAVAWANMADNAATTPNTQTAVALHTGDPGDTGSMSTSEIAYTSYARAAVARSSTGWSINSTGTMVPVANIDFAAGTGGSGTATFASVGKQGAGAADILWSGSVSPSIVTGNGVTPRLTTATTVTLD